eukprot:TRINITY_DN20645_c0_g1_i1.p1 TRINITY_DN20645_c0_g1~~TRINITY_DN20645_c0_g1_i1.p1  ORF type:complete len:259 (+),score=39.28 TRINITY_DN20645_c0_g1_i1:74-850(+)
MQEKNTTPATKTLTLHVKASFKEEIRRLEVITGEDTCYTDLKLQVLKVFSFDEICKGLVLKYVDEDQDQITFSSNAELLHGLKHLASVNPEKTNFLRLFLIQKETASALSASVQRAREYVTEAKKSKRLVDVGPPLKQHNLGKRYNARLVKHLTIPKDTKLRPGEEFVKKWLIRNTGLTCWSFGSALVFNSKRTGDQMGGPDRVLMSYSDPIFPDVEGVISVTLRAPMQPGHYQGFWKLAAPDGQSFGTRLPVNIIVA